MDDAALLNRWRSGDHGAGSELFGRHFADIYAFLRHKLAEPAVAEDLAQDTFASCVRNAAALRDPSKFRTYLFSTAYNRLVDHLRSCSRETTTTTGVSRLPDHSPSPSTSLRATEQSESLRRAIKTLSTEHQIVIDLYYAEGFRGPQLAQILRVPEPTVRSRLRRAKAALREQLCAAPHPTDGRPHELE